MRKDKKGQGLPSVFSNSRNSSVPVVPIFPACPISRAFPTGIYSNISFSKYSLNAEAFDLGHKNTILSLSCFCMLHSCCLCYKYRERGFQEGEILLILGVRR